MSDRDRGSRGGGDAPRARPPATDTQRTRRTAGHDARHGDEHPQEDSRPSRRAADAPAEGLVFGFQAVKTALVVSPRRVERLLLERGKHDPRTRDLVALARTNGVPFQQVPESALDRLAGSVRHQGVAARMAGTDLLTAESLIASLPQDGIALVLDGVEDPRNVGAVIRTAAGFGVSGLFLPGWRSAGVGPGASRTAAGGLELLPVARAGNTARLIEKLGDIGYRAVALEPEEGLTLWEADLTGPLVLVAGGEEKGVRPSVATRCASRVRIPIRAEIGSLNVSVAVAIVLSEVVRQRMASGSPGTQQVQPIHGNASPAGDGKENS